MLLPIIAIFALTRAPLSWLRLPLAPDDRRLWSACTCTMRLGTCGSKKLLVNELCCRVTSG